jgi:hypothetical protein
VPPGSDGQPRAGHYIGSQHSDDGWSLVRLCQVIGENWRSNRGRPYDAPVIPCAYLRVFRPLETFAETERLRWERYIISGTRPSPLPPIYREESLVADGSLGLIASNEGDHADIRLVEGRYFVCPWRTRLRVLASILSLRESSPFEMADAFVPDSEARRAARELARLKRREPTAVPSMLQSPWHVPIRWFALFDEEERRVVERPEGGHRLFYWTPIGTARRRAEAALEALQRSQLEPVSSMIKEMLEWLAAFDARSMVELDYADVSAMFGWDELDNDHSARDIQAAVTGLMEGDLTLATEMYQAVAQHWAEVRSRESLN